MVFGKVLPKYEDKNITENKMNYIEESEQNALSVIDNESSTITKITDDETMSKASDMLKVIKTYEKKIEEKRKLS